MSAAASHQKPAVSGTLGIARVLELPAVAAGEPEVLGGADLLGNPVRWVHVAETPDLAELLSGGELVLTTGMAFGEAGAGVAGFLAQVRAAGASGLIVELVAGADRERGASIAALRRLAGQAGFPVILLHKRVRFVEITEVVHRMLVSDQLAALERSRTIHEVFTALSLQNATEEGIVARAAELIGAPVVLEDVAHLVLGFDAGPEPDAELLAHWPERSRRVGYLESTGRGAGEESWLQTPVGIQGQRWGRLVVPGELADDEDATMVLERAGQTLSIARLAGRDQKELLHQARAGLLHELRQQHALGEGEVLIRAGALGLGEAPHYVPVVFRLDVRAGQTPTGVQLRERALLDALNAVVESARATALAASLQSGQIGMVLGVGARQLEEPLLERICRQLAQGQGSVDWSVGVGRGRKNVKDAAHGLEEAVQVAETVATFDTRARPFYRFADVRLRGLLALMHEDARLRSFAEAELAGILDPLDEPALELLGLYLKHGGNKSALARTGFLSRPALYARLEKLEDKLGVSLDDAESRTSLHVALLWRDLGRRH
ncbi:PucR family transcriptional regulator ligand-binding domain-containing protein [Paeniglutamicibacter sp. ABSL32-1]|uniref:PucR family transcriptional regulator n=1 Tax=Paeniglutamicibacter quisquiliarum TaxID=2849498 RepID=UPI001C2D051E|nr:PucR family transcriptional regulator [Paeniglutamicibacter quisquiliarum]MBV1780558.1 PucR family transcriptional regulator ligand-binding domain-containing protein [Paeniglutamicibacter quisquiliarum]